MAVPKGTVRKQVDIPDEMWRRIAVFRHAEMIGSEAETMRRLLAAGLDAWEEDKKRGDPPSGEPPPRHEP